MGQTHLKKQPKVHNDKHSSLKGTLASVFILGLIIIVTWVGVYFLFLDRL